MKKLNKKQIRRLILKELESMGEDVLKPFPQGKEKQYTPPLGSSEKRKSHSCSIHGRMYEKDCSECGQMYEEELKAINEGSCGCESTSVNSSSYPFSKDVDLENEMDIDYKGIIKNILGMHNSDHDHMTHKHSKSHKGAYMSKSQLHKVAKYSKKLSEMIPDGHNLEDWMRTKIAQIADDISEVYHALDHDIYRGKIK